MQERIIYFYGKRDCHLCDEVRNMLRMALPKGVVVYDYDVEEDAALTAEYGQIIPVLRSSFNDDELAYPFDYDQLCRWLDQQMSVSTQNNNQSSS